MVVIFNSAGKAVSRSKNLRGITDWCRKNAAGAEVVQVMALPNGGATFYVRWYDKTWVSTQFASYEVAVKFAATPRFAGAKQHFIDNK